MRVASAERRWMLMSWTTKISNLNRHQETIAVKISPPLRWQLVGKLTSSKKHTLRTDTSIKHQKYNEICSSFLPSCSIGSIVCHCLCSCSFVHSGMLNFPTLFLRTRRRRRSWSWLGWNVWNVSRWLNPSLVAGRFESIHQLVCTWFHFCSWAFYVVLIFLLY